MLPKYRYKSLSDETVETGHSIRALQREVIGLLKRIDALESVVEELRDIRHIDDGGQEDGFDDGGWR